ncbi:MAG TPA: hypothetical protein V6C50_05385, partial [Crinalium sp.]
MTKALKPLPSDPLASGSRSKAFHPKSVSRRTSPFNRYAQGTTQQRPFIVPQELTPNVEVGDCMQRDSILGVEPMKLKPIGQQVV